MTSPFALVEIALKDLIEDIYAPASGRVGGDLSYDGEAELYVFIGLVPGGGRTNQIEGEWAVDIDCFSPTYGQAMEHALALEALLLRGRFPGADMIIDSVFQNESPSERPWEDENVARVGATYVFSARRSG